MFTKFRIEDLCLEKVFCLTVDHVYKNVHSLLSTGNDLTRKPPKRSSAPYLSSVASFNECSQKTKSKSIHSGIEVNVCRVSCAETCLQNSIDCLLFWKPILHLRNLLIYSVSQRSLCLCLCGCNSITVIVSRPLIKVANVSDWS